MKRSSGLTVDLSDYESVGKRLVKALLLHFPFTLSGSLLLLLVVIIDRRAVLRADVATLAIERRRVVDREEDRE